MEWKIFWLLVSSYDNLYWSQLLCCCCCCCGGGGGGGGGGGLRGIIFLYELLFTIFCFDVDGELIFLIYVYSFCHREVQFFDYPFMVRWKSDGIGWWKMTDEQISIENSTRISQKGKFTFSYFKYFNFRKSKFWIETTASGSLVRKFIYCATEPVDVPYKWQSKKTGSDWCCYL